jgi:hypothetical protein
MSTEAKVDFGGIVLRNTKAGTGRQLAVTPENSAMKHLAYARVILNSATPAVSFTSGGRETALICLSGRANVKTDGQEVPLGRFDGPRDSLIGISTESEADVAEFSADVKDTHATKLVRYAETSQDPGAGVHFGWHGFHSPSESADCKECASGPAAGWIYALRAGQLDQLAAT